MKTVQTFIAVQMLAVACFCTQEPLVERGQGKSISFDGDTANDVPSDLAQSDPSAPQTRFFGGGGFGGGGGGLFGGGGGGGLFGGIGNALGNIFNPCGSCGHHEPIKSRDCCMSGESHCCRYVASGFNVGGFGGHGGGFGGHHGGGFGGHQGGGFGGHHGNGHGFGAGHGNGHTGAIVTSHGKPHVGPPGIPTTGHLGGFGNGHGHGGGGFGNGHGGGGFGNGHGGGGFHATTKPGYCGKASLFGGLFGTRSLADEEGKSFADDASAGPVGPPQSPDARGDKIRFTRQITISEKGEHDAEVASADPQQRFLFGLKNPLCRDECFTDFHCPGHLKCCLDFGKCKKCSSNIRYY